MSRTITITGQMGRSYEAQGTERQRVTLAADSVALHARKSREVPGRASDSMRVTGNGAGMSVTRRGAAAGPDITSRPVGESAPISTGMGQDTHSPSSIDSATAGIRESGRIGHVLGRGSALSLAERETTVTATDADAIVRIWSCQRKYITRLRRHPSFTEVDSGYFGGVEWAEFTIPARDWNPATGAKRKVTMTDEQKAASAARLRELAAFRAEVAP